MALFDKLKKQVSEKITDGISAAQEQIKDKAEELTPLAKNKEYQEKIKTLESENKRLQSILSPELIDSTEAISALDKERETLEIKIQRLSNKLLNLESEIKSKKKELIILDDETLYQDFGLYAPIYDLVNSEAYKDRITVIRQRQKDMIKSDTACTYSKNMTLNNSLSKGQIMVKDNFKQDLRTFNN